jgi:3-hydroxy-9,10-secoandrosta-1,3,5(10)-triene-9,17-dione monooxygenase reductase component
MGRCRDFFRSQIWDLRSGIWDLSSFMPSVDPDAFRDVCSRFTTGVCVVTSSGAEGPSGLTANAVASLSLDPPLMIVCFDRGSRTLAAIERSRRLAIHFLAHEQENLAARFASKLPEAEKFRGVDWSDRHGVPVLSGTIGGLACALRDLVPGGDHLIAVAEVEGLWRNEGRPLVFFRGDYWRLAGGEPAPSEVDEALEP